MPGVRAQPAMIIPSGGLNMQTGSKRRGVSAHRCVKTRCCEFGFLLAHAVAMPELTTVEIPRAFLVHEENQVLRAGGVTDRDESVRGSSCLRGFALDTLLGVRLDAHSILAEGTLSGVENFVSEISQ